MSIDRDTPIIRVRHRGAPIAIGGNNASQKKTPEGSSRRMPYVQAT